MMDGNRVFNSYLFCPLWASIYHRLDLLIVSQFLYVMIGARRKLPPVQLLFPRVTNLLNLNFRVFFTDINLPSWLATRKSRSENIFVRSRLVDWPDLKFKYEKIRRFLSYFGLLGSPHNAIQVIFMAFYFSIQWLMCMLKTWLKMKEIL